MISSCKVTLTCAACGKTFLRYPSQATRKEHFCSQECRKKPKALRVCEVCGKAFEVWPCLSAARHCSLQCVGKGRMLRQAVPCSVCGRVITRHACSVRRSKQHFCSRACYGVAAKARYNKQVVVECAQCGKSISRKRHKLKDTAHQFCSEPCMHAWQAAHWVGENNPHWQGGHVDYYGPNWKRQAAAARERDNGACQLCGKTERKMRRRLDVHHVQPFRSFGYIAGENENYKEANRLDNLISLCQACHKKVEIGSASVQLKLL